MVLVCTVINRVFSLKGEKAWKVERMQVRGGGRRRQERNLSLKGNIAILLILYILPTEIQEAVTCQVWQDIK